MLHLRRNCSFARFDAPTNKLTNYTKKTLFEKVAGSQLVTKVPAFHRTQRFNAAFTKAHHLFLSLTNPIQSIHTTSLLDDGF